MRPLMEYSIIPLGTDRENTLDFISERLSHYEPSITLKEVISDVNGKDIELPLKVYYDKIIRTPISIQLICDGGTLIPLIHQYTSTLNSPLAMIEYDNSDDKIRGYFMYPEVESKVHVLFEVDYYDFTYKNGDRWLEDIENLILSTRIL